MKEEIIKQIKAIIGEYGSFSTFEIQAESSPFYGSLGKFFGLVEEFFQDRCTIVVYSSDEDSTEQDQFDLPYEDFLEFDTLKEILDLCNVWQKQNDEENGKF